MKYFVKDLIRALRLPFSTASAFPFIFGSMIDRNSFSIASFLLGLISVVCAHLSANLINDKADSESRADWQDSTPYNFFGGSKLIQEGVFSEAFYLKLSLIFAGISFVSACAIAIILKSALVFYLFLAVLFLSWSYSVKPLQLSYRRMGEPVIFLLFGPIVVMGGYFIQTGIFPDWKSFLLSLPFGFFTTAILFANEIPDLQDDKSAGKFTWVSVVGGSRAYLVYYALMGLAFISIALGVIMHILNPIALFSMALIILVGKAGNIMKNDPSDKKKLVESSKMTIAVHALASLMLIAGVLL